MNVFLLHRDRDFELKQELPPNETALLQDLELPILIGAMAGEDALLQEVAGVALLSSGANDVRTVQHRQAVLQDCIENETTVRALFRIAVETFEGKRRQWFGIFSRSPSGILNESINLLHLFVGGLRQLRETADEHGASFHSLGFLRLFEELRVELTEEYLARVTAHLRELKFDSGALLSASLGPGNELRDHLLRRPGPKPHWLDRILGDVPPQYTFRIAPRDEAGSRALSELRDRGINQVANGLAQSSDHILRFFDLLRTELGFYVCCLNLRQRLLSLETPVCFPEAHEAGTRRLRFHELLEPCLALKLGRPTVGNTLEANGKSLIVITGANQGGKSTFLRSIGVATLMMQAGMFVAAKAFAGELSTGVATHYKREEDATMTSGKFDEELARMSDLVGSLLPNSLMLFNESFASTNEREGSEIARQVTRALLDAKVRVVFVTHLHEFSSGLLRERREDWMFLRAERDRSFRIVEGEPLETSHGLDLYEDIFVHPAVDNVRDNHYASGKEIG